MKIMYVYILKCNDGSYYTGVTNNLERRIEQHKQGINKNCYTFKRRPIELVYNKIFDSPIKAIAFEKQIKGWNRKKKVALINGDFEELKKLSNYKPYRHSSTSSD